MIGRLGLGGRAAECRLHLDELPTGAEHDRVDPLGDGAGCPAQRLQRIAKIGGEGGVGTQPVGTQVHPPIVPDRPRPAGPIGESAACAAYRAVATTSANLTAVALACSGVAASTMTRINCSVPEGRSSTRPVSPSSCSAAATAART